MPKISGWATRLRLISGLTMFAFVTTHLLNHALGLWSLDAMRGVQRVFLGAWTNPFGATLLSAALVTHLTLVGWKQVQRRTWRMPVVELVRILLGITVLFLLTAHVLGNYVLYRQPGAHDTYPTFLLGFETEKQIRQTLLLVAAWCHGCIGVHRWLRLRGGYRRLLPLLFPLAVLIPTLALLGVASGYKEVQRLALDPAWRAAIAANLPKPVPALTHYLMPWWMVTALSTGSFVALVLIAHGLVRLWSSRRHGMVSIRYPGNRVVRVAYGTSVLEASAIGGIAHASVCGGRGRCSTCRIQVHGAIKNLTPPSAEEERVLKRIGAPQGVRLACQLRPREDLVVTPLVPHTVGPEQARPQGRFLFGKEMEIAIMFTDVRGFTTLTEKKLAYDIVHILNEYFEAMSGAIEDNGGYLDKFIGDGIMALFGLKDGPAAGCRAALATAKAMAERLEELNRRLAGDLPEPMRIGIGIHVGTAIVGEMGHSSASAVTAIGDAVNVASRLEGLTKAAKSQLIVATDVARLAGVSLTGFPRYRVRVRGREEPLVIHALPSALSLPDLGQLPAGSKTPMVKTPTVKATGDRLAAQGKP